MISVPLSLYVHIPWCVRKCPYCDFNSHESGGELPEDDYVGALLRDLESDLVDFSPSRELQSIFIGGGTPSLFSPEAIGKLLEGIGARCPVSASAEVTLEANPGTVTEARDRFSGLLDAGVNRLSLGVQSFSDESLHALGRIHDADEALMAYESARRAGFENINLDLMHGLPGQDTAGALGDLELAISLAPDHISWYQLTIEPNTVFHKRPPPLPDDDTLWVIYERGMRLLESRGYHRYEVSAFAGDGMRSAHNLNYWQFGDYIGIGAGAHGKLTRVDGVARTVKTRSPRDYLTHQRRVTEAVDPPQLPLEFMMNGLRLCEGFKLDLFEERTGLPRTTLDGFLEAASARSLVEVADGHVRPTDRGTRFLNDLLLMVDAGTVARSSS